RRQRRGAPSPRPAEIGFVLLPDVVLLDVAGQADAFRNANDRMPGSYRLRFVAPHTTVAAAVGLTLSRLEPLPARLAPGTILVLTGVSPAAIDPQAPAACWPPTPGYSPGAQAPHLTRTSKSCAASSRARVCSTTASSSRTERSSPAPASPRDSIWRCTSSVSNRVRASPPRSPATWWCICAAPAAIRRALTLGDASQP